MKMMAEQELFPQLSGHTPPNVFTIRTRGVTEEDIFLKLCPGLWEQLEAFGKVASLPRNTGIDLNVTLPSSNSAELENFLNQSPLKNHIWQLGTLPLPAWVLNKMKERKTHTGFGGIRYGRFALFPDHGYSRRQCQFSRQCRRLPKHYQKKYPFRARKKSPYR